MSCDDVDPTRVEYTADRIRTLPEPRTFRELMELMRTHPSMFLGSKSLLRFAAWLQGYWYARRLAESDCSEDESKFRDGFDPFVCDRYRWHDVGGWAAKIAYYHRDDADALDEFFLLLDQFWAVK